MGTMVTMSEDRRAEGQLEESPWDKASGAFRAWRAGDATAVDDLVAAAVRETPGPVSVERSDVLRETLRVLHTPALPGLPPLTGGLVGSLGWDVLRQWEPTLRAIAPVEHDTAPALVGGVGSHRCHLPEPLDQEIGAGDDLEEPAGR